MFEHTAKLAWPEVRSLAEYFCASTAHNTPELYAEMQGIADGAGVDLLDIVALNWRSEISLGQASDGCTSLSWRKNGAARVLAQNWDWTTLVRDNLAVVQIERPDKPVIYMVTEVSTNCLLDCNASVLWGWLISMAGAFMGGNRPE